MMFSLRKIKLAEQHIYSNKIARNICC